LVRLGNKVSIVHIDKYYDFYKKYYYFIKKTIFVMNLIKKSISVILYLIMISFISCQDNKKKPNSGDEDTIENSVLNNQEGNQKYLYNKDTLYALVDNSLTSYYIYKGHPFGFEYEMLALFAKENNMVLKIRIIRDAAHILDSLNAGKGDIAAANLTITRKRLQKANFTKYLFRTRQILVQQLPDHRHKMTHDQIEKQLIRDRLDLGNRTIHLRPNTSYYEQLNSFIQETNTHVNIATVADSILTEELMEMVSSGEIDFTISDENRAKTYVSFIDNVDISTPMSLGEPIGWAVNKKSDKLLHLINAWIDKQKGSLIYNTIWNKYFNLNRAAQRLVKKELKTYKKGKLSPYDNLIKQYAQQIDWDWILLTAQMYQESQFNPKIISNRGAVGLMQVLPATAKSFGISKKQLFIPVDNLKAGTNQLVWLRNQWEKSIADSVEVIRFILGSYNVGYGHVRDAQRLAKKHGLDPNIWDENISKMLIKKSTSGYYNDPVVKYGYCRGTEPVHYVETIFKNYRLYNDFLR